MNDLLGPNDPACVELTGNALSPGPFVLVGDHAGDAIPAALGDLGVSQADRARHIAVDIGSAALGLALARRLDAPFVAQAYSRLVIDCNRYPDHPEAVVETSDGTGVPGNVRLTPGQRQARIDAVFEPYHAAIEHLLDKREAAGLASVLISVHSFTPVWQGRRRDYHFGVLHDGHRDDFALAVLDRLTREKDWTVADNQPYVMDETDYTVPRHAYPRDLPYLEIEVRQDLLPRRADEVAEVLARALAMARSGTAASR
ncbi:N-formylglutamate amidohydrolase [Aurantiacibacter spongiae]|uniref:N-formylglutamate amidohydrolase n=1 Tax=Aurantiacibacter spongiae TaxID=2488860 RepID=UPI0018F8858E|nr:N-formylglutamate amidohydrolase [Aurantiacibacter spongiae]